MVLYNILGLNKVFLLIIYCPSDNRGTINTSQTDLQTIDGLDFELQKRLKNDPKLPNFLKFSNDLKNVSRHCTEQYLRGVDHFSNRWA